MYSDPVGRRIKIINNLMKRSIQSLVVSANTQYIYIFFEDRTILKEILDLV